MIAIPIALFITFIVFAVFLLAEIVIAIVSYITYCHYKDAEIKKQTAKKYGTQEEDE